MCGKQVRAQNCTTTTAKPSVAKVAFDLMRRRTCSISPTGAWELQQAHCHCSGRCAGQQWTPSKAPCLLCPFAQQFVFATRVLWRVEPPLTTFRRVMTPHELRVLSFLWRIRKRGSKRVTKQVGRVVKGQLARWDSGEAPTVQLWNLPRSGMKLHVHVAGEGVLHPTRLRKNHQIVQQTLGCRASIMGDARQWRRIEKKIEEVKKNRLFDVPGIMRLGSFVSYWRRLFSTWITGVEMARSMHDLVTSQSSEGRIDFPDFWNASYEDCVCVEKDNLQYLSFQKESQCWRAAYSQNTIDSWEGVNLLTCIYNHLHDLWPFSRNREFMMQLKTYQTCSIFACRMTTFKTSIQDGIKFYQEQLKCLPENVLEGLYKKKLQVSEQLPTVLGDVQPRIESRSSDTDLPKMVKMAGQHIDQTIKAVSKLGHERIETSFHDTYGHNYA